MSLINKMLQDLEARDHAGAPKTPAPPFEDLRAVQYKPAGSSRARVAFIVLLIAAGLAIGAYSYQSFRGQDVSTTITPAPVRVARVVPATMETPPAQSPAEPVVAAPPQSSDVVRPAAAQPLAEEKAVPPVKQPAASKPAPKKAIKAQAPRTRAAAANKPVPVIESSAHGEIDKDKVVIEKSNRPSTPQDQAEAGYRQAGQYMQQGRGEDARAALNAALSIYPGHHQARELAAALAIQNGRMREAQDLLTQGIKLAPTRLSFAQLLARVYLEQGDEVQAIATLEAARSAGAGNADYLSFLAALYQRAGRHADAVSAYRDTIAARSQDARAWLGLGISLEATRDPAGASQAYERALQLGGLDTKLGQYASQRLSALKK